MSSLETYAFDNFIAGQDPDPVTREIVLEHGANVAKYQLLALDTSSKKWKAYDRAGSNGVNVPSAIACEAIDATAADAVGPAFIEGCFNEDKVVFPSGESLDEVFRLKLRDYNIVLKKVQAA